MIDVPTFAVVTGNCYALRMTGNDTAHRGRNQGDRLAARPLHVVIIGGGIGGLCLAQGLRKSGISVGVFERDTSALFRNQGYRIGLKESGAGALHDCLPENLFALCVATSIKQATRMIFMDEQLTVRFARPIRPAEPGLAGFGVNRLTLREILLAGLDGVVQFGKTFDRYDPSADGQVRAYFTDGTSVSADLLVGADGTGSAVRRQLLPGAVIDELDWAIYGRTPITAGALDRLPDVLVDSFNRVAGPGGAGVAVATCQSREPAGRAAARLAPGLYLTDLPGYLSWTLPLPSSGERAADAAALHRLASGMVQGWHPAIGEIIAAADVPATFAVRITSARPVPQWSVPGVTLLGDAIHTMSPGRGDGAGIALKDARLLRAAIVAAAAGQIPLARAVAGYEAEMLRYGFQAVADSLNKPFAPRPGGAARHIAVRPAT
jgi:2-polyprenyl-6-methoxyphenol hydroxylase-like FAD-dependent oxidoreductase